MYKILLPLPALVVKPNSWTLNQLNIRFVLTRDALHPQDASLTFAAVRRCNRGDD